MKKNDRFTKMTETPVSRLVLSLALPCVLSMLITSIYNMADTFFVGQISNSASGAVGVAASLMSIIQALGFMMGQGSGSMISRKLGAQDKEGAIRIASTSFYTCLGIGLAFMIFCQIFLSPLMIFMGSTDTILPHAIGYSRFILFAAPVMMTSLVMNNILRYEGKAFFSMIALVTGGLLNIALDPLFIFVFKMGTAGAGCATAISQCVSFALLLSAFLRGKTVSKFRISAFTRSGLEFLTIPATGLPSFGRQGIASIAMTLLNRAARVYGDPAVSAMSIVSRIFMFLLSVVIGIGQGFQPVAGFNYGAKKFRRVKEANHFTILFSMICLTVILIVTSIFAPQLIRAFRDDDVVYSIALPAFRYQSITLLLQPFTICANMLFQSTGKTIRATLLSVCRQGIFFIPLIIVLPSLFELTGIQICQPVADLFSFIVSVPLTLNYYKQLDQMQLEADKEMQASD